MDRKAETPFFTGYDDHLFREGKNYELYKKMGAHKMNVGGVEGTEFVLWAPNAKTVSVLTDGNGWSVGSDVMKKTENGMWELFIPGACEGTRYRYAVTCADGTVKFKSDPFAFSAEMRPSNASIVADSDRYVWRDGEYMSRRDNGSMWKKPLAIYEVHLGSWKKDYSQNSGGFLNYRRLAAELSEYVSFMGYTDVELIGICEHPFDGSWGYQATGFFAPTSRYGTPDDFRFFVDAMHEKGIGVILDFVPAHFAKDSFGLEYFDGTPLYESADPLLAEYPEWGTHAFDHSKPEVRSFLISSAFYWLNEFHIDALRVDAVAAMLYTSFSREKWRPNRFGGQENLESIGFLRQMNRAVKDMTTGYVIAEDSSIMRGVTADPEYGGLGFTFKWNMGWMNESLRYIEKDPIYRQYHHDLITHPSEYAQNENYILVLSHDEVVHLKKSMLMKMPGPMPDKLGCLKAFYTYMFTHPGKKLLFMGQDFAVENEWSEEREINWYFAEEKWHRDVLMCVKGLLEIYKKYPVLYTDAKDGNIFEWVNRSDSSRNIISYIRRNPWNYSGSLLVVCNFAPVEYCDYTVGVPDGGEYRRVFSTFDSLPDSDASGFSCRPEPRECDGYRYTLTYRLRPYEAAVFGTVDQPGPPAAEAEAPTEKAKKPKRASKQR